ncbi:MAG: DnaJ domain-containing protein [Deltaproteobacteria bacterium]|nr:DnaJ domain-containing protein [Deltaproteobacteria bacterium]
MSRLRDLADRAGLEDLLGRLATGSEELAHVDAEELSAERQGRKAAGPRNPENNPRAKHADGSEASRQSRRKAADARESVVRAERERREEADRKAHEAAFREAKARADQQAEAEYQRFRSSAGAGASAGASSSSSRKRRSPFGQDADLAKHYKTLNLSYGAEWTEVRSAYRKLMRKYHPDLHNQSAKKQKAATELTVQITQAYNALEKHLKD